MDEIELLTVVIPPRDRGTGPADGLALAPHHPIARTAQADGPAGAVQGGFIGIRRPSAFPVAFLPRLGSAWHWPLVVNIGKSTIPGDHQ